MRPHEGEQAQIAIRVANAQLIHLQVPETQVAVVILHALAQQAHAVLFRQQKRSGVRLRLFVKAILLLVVVEP